MSKYPKINYIGNKNKLTDWIVDNFPYSKGTVLDLFCGGCSVSYALKEKGYKVYSNDALYSNYVLAKAIIENNNVTLKKEDFDFLGFTFYNTKTRTGKYRIGVRTSKKKLKAKKQAAKAWLKTRLTKPLALTMKILAAVVRGHCNYYGVNGNFHAIQNFWKYLKYETYRMLNRRDQKGKFRYEKYLRVWNYYISEPHLTTDIWNWNPMTA